MYPCSSVLSVLSSAIMSNIYQNEMAQLKGPGYVHTRQALFKGRKLIAGSGVTLSVLSSTAGVFPSLCLQWEIIAILRGVSACVDFLLNSAEK